jgi:hypothetical protein
LGVPIGYLVNTGIIAVVALSAVSRHRPSRSSPFGLRGIFGVLLNWPLAVFLLLAASTALAIAQNGVGSPVFGIGLGFAVLATAGLVVLARRARATGPALERALDEGLGAGWRDGVEAGLAAGSAVGPPSPASCSRRSRSVVRSSASRASATAPRAEGTCSTSIEIAPVVRAGRRSSISTAERSASAASVSGHVTCCIGSPPTAGCASARTTDSGQPVSPTR